MISDSNNFVIFSIGNSDVAFFHYGEDYLPWFFACARWHCQNVGRVAGTSLCGAHRSTVQYYHGDDGTGQSRNRRRHRIGGELGHEKDYCDMHDISKVTLSMIGALTRSKNGRVVNPFPEGVAMVKRYRDMAVHFSYSTRHDRLLEHADQVNGPKIRLKVDLNETRVTAKHNLLHSCLRMHKPLKSYALAQTPSPPWMLTEAEWTTSAELESIMQVTDEAVKLCQHEKLYLGAVGPELKRRMIEKLRATEFDVIDLDRVTASPRLPRVKVLEADMTPIAKTALQRARLEADERRFCGNDGETVRNLDYKYAHRELIATLLDFRTLGCEHLTPADRIQAKKLLKEHYIVYGKRAWDFARESAAPAPAPTTSSPSEARPMILDAWDEVDADSEQASGAEDEDVPPDFGTQFETVFKNWINYRRSIKWAVEFPELGKKYSSEVTQRPGFRYDVVDDLFDLNVGKLYKKIAGDQKYGFLPDMARGSAGSIGVLGAQSYCERVVSAANIIMTKGRTLLSDEELDMLATLRMNREFMDWARAKYGPDLRTKLVDASKTILDDP